MPREHRSRSPVMRRLIAGVSTALLSLTAWALAPTVPAAAAGGPVTTTTSATLTFATKDQGMWGPGTPTALGSGNVNLFTPITWNQSASASNIVSLQVDKNLDVDSTNGGDTDGDAGNDNDQSCTLWNNDWNGSIQEDGEINGQDNDNDVSSDGQTCVDSNADIDYINVDTDGDGGNDNDEVATQWGGSISGQTSGDIGMQMALQNIAGGTVSVNYPVAVTQSVTAPGNYVKPGDQVTFASSWHAQSGASLTTTAATGAAGLDGTFGFSATAGGQICVSACSNDTVLGVTVPDKSYTVLSPVGTSGSVSAPGVTGTVTAPSFGVASSNLTGNTLTASGTAPIWRLNVSLGGMVQALSGIPLSASASLAGVDFGYTILSGNANPTYSAAQTLTFSPTLMETLTFSTPVTFTAYDTGGGVYSTGTSATVTFPAGGKAEITVPSLSSGSLTYSTAYALSGTDFTNNSSVQGSVAASLSALSLNANFTNAGGFNLGPAYQTSSTGSYNVPLYGDKSPFGLTSPSWTLGGFPAVPGGTGALPVDSTPPVTTASVAGPLGNGGWYTGPATVTLNATDSGSGVAATYYSVDGGPAQTYGVPFTISANGTHSVDYYSVDNAGNVETTQTSTVKIDSTPPTTSGGVSGPGSNGWYRNAVLTLTAQDNVGGSGIASTTYNLMPGGAVQTYTGPVSFSNDGAYTVAYGSTDVAGNAETRHLISFKVDSTPPSTTASVAGTPGDGGWYVSPVTVTLNATDNPGGSGVAGTLYSVDGGAPQPYVVPFTISQNGSHLVVFYSSDLAGNAEAPQQLAVRIDQTPPTTTAAVSGTMGTNGWYKAGTPVVLTLSATDNANGSGVASTTYAVNGGPLQNYTAPVTFTDGVYTVAYGSMDAAGNVETTKTVSFKVDQTPPVVTYTGNTGTYTIDQTVDITCTASDNLSGVATDTCSNLDIPAYQLSLGSHTLSATATDNAGNTGSGATTFTVSVTYASLCGLTTQFVSKSGVAGSLCSKLDAASAAGNAKTAANILSAYEHELSAQSGKSISATDVSILDSYVTALEN